MKLTNLFCRHIKRHISLTALLLTGMTLGSATAGATTLKISHVRPQGTVADKDIKQFGAELTKATQGDLKLRVYAANALGDYTLVQERVAVGAVDMALQPVSTSTDRRMQIGLLPYLANNWRQAKQVFGLGSPVREAIASLYAKQGITMLAAYPVYFGGISLNRDAKSPGDPMVKKGIKLRVPPIKSFQLLADNLGYIGSPLPFSEAFTAVETGVVDGVIGSGAEGYYASFRDVTKTYIPLNTHFEIWYLIMNSETFDDLSKADQQALKTTANKFESRRWLHAESDQAANEQKLADNGTKIIRINDKQLEEIGQHIRKTVWPVILKDIGQKWGQSVLDKTYQ